MKLVGSAFGGVAKGGCYLCLATTDLVSLEISIPGEGVLCLCQSDIGQAARVIGWLPPTESAQLRELVVTQRQEIKAMKQMIDEHVKRIDVLLAALTDLESHGIVSATGNGKTTHTHVVEESIGE